MLKLIAEFLIAGMIFLGSMPLWNKSLEHGPSRVDPRILDQLDFNMGSFVRKDFDVR
jgi:hypothetical protein